MGISAYFYESADVKKAFIDHNESLLQEAIHILVACLQSWSKVLIAGNGWSAADSQHWAAELMGRYKLERNPLPAIALTTDTSNLTAVGNDYGFDEVFARQIAWLGHEGDIFVCISTSGNSVNIIKALSVCKARGIKTLALLGKWGGKIKDMVDVALVVPSDNTPRIQECHQTIYHTICEEIELKLTNTWT
jgi:D-sedoheptulose 7-phosphate isomerase